jgi:hypothetical protein
MAHGRFWFEATFVSGHTALWHIPPWQECPQLPQFRGSVVISTHVPPQTVCGATHPVPLLDAALLDVVLPLLDAALLDAALLDAALLDAVLPLLDAVLPLLDAVLPLLAVPLPPAPR